jgi:hypothetical protein
MSISPPRHNGRRRHPVHDRPTAAPAAPGQTPTAPLAPSPEDALRILATLLRRYWSRRRAQAREQSEH